MREPWRERHYLYLDEAGRYANRNLADLLIYKRKSGLRVTIAHQYFGQFEDPYVLDAVNNLCKIKIAFNIPNPDDRMKIVKAMYGGDLNDRDVSYALKNLRQQHCVIMLPKQDPKIVRVPDVRDIKLPDGALEEYIKKIYKNLWYITPNEVIHDQKERLFENSNEIHIQTKQTRTDPRTLEDGEVVDGSASYHTNLRKAEGDLSVFDYFDRTYRVRGNPPSA